jgi:DNA-binding NarL/FixJ family response regulator
MIIGSVRLYCEGLAATLARREDMTVVAALSGQDATVERIREAAVDVVIIDVQTSDLLQFVPVVRRECPSVKVVAFAVEAREDSLVTCAEVGVAGYVTCNADVDLLVHVIQTVVHHEFVCPPSVAETLVRRLAKRGHRVDAADEEPLTGRERQILALICEGLSNKEIAQVCSISEATVKNHVHHLLEKHKLRTRGQLAARRAGVAASSRQR